MSSSPKPEARPFPHSAHCEYFQATMELVGKRWTASILRTLFAGCSRFTEMAQAIPGISNRLLSERLEELQAAGLVASTQDARSVYSLTEKGRDLRRALAEIERWNQTWLHAEDPEPDQIGR